MAIIQISKIQQRSGNLVDLPQLDEAQFGWATDAKRLFIGKTSPNENIEVLTSYSNISFSQIDGSDGGNFNISNSTSGQVLTYVSTTNTWQNWPSTDILNANANFKLDLGDVGNIKMDGGATGYILETDGVGNLSWTSKGTLRTVITALSNATPIIMTVATATPYTNGLAVTVSGANASNANTIVNGKTFYVKVSNNFPTSGNVELYTTSDLAPGNAAVGTGLNSYVANSGIATALISGSGVSNAGGSVNTIQFNNSGVLNGSANFTITGGNLVTLTGNFSASNIAGGNLVSANFLTGTLTTAAQPNITSTGTLAGLVVAGNITPSANITYNLGNNTNRFNDLYLANSTIYLGAQTISANASSVIVSGNLVANIVGNVSGNVTTAGTVTTNAQPNITSVGTLTSVSVSGNANVGNLNTSGLITATGNLNAGNIITAGIVSAAGNIITAGIVSATGNLNAGNIITAGSVSATGNGTFGNVSATTFTGNLSGNATTAGTVITAAQPNITSTGTLASLSVTANANIGNIGTVGLITATGNIRGANIITGGIMSATGNITANFFIGNGSQLSGLPSGTSITNGNSNVTVTANGNVNISAVGTSNVVVITNTGTNIAGTISASGNANVGNIGAVGGIFTGNVSAANFIGTGAGSPTINSSGSLSISATSGVTLNNVVTLSTGGNTTAGNITGNWTLTSGSRLQATYADLAEYYEADDNYEPGTVLAFGGAKEVTIAEDGTTRVAGVVSTNPAYAMNANCQGIAVAIALQGRVPTKVRGTVRKGDMMVSAGNGFARPWNNPAMGTVIGKALEDFDGVEGIIEIAVGRL